MSVSRRRPVVQFWGSRERLSAADPTLVKRRYVEWSDMSLGAANRHHLVFYGISARSAATYTVQLNGLVWEWLASDRDGDVRIATVDRNGEVFGLDCDGGSSMPVRPSGAEAGRR